MKGICCYFVACFTIVTLCGCSFTKPATGGKSTDVDHSISFLIKHINDVEAYGKMDLTPSVYGLIEKGRPALNNELFDLLLSEDRYTRVRAKHVLYGVICCEAGFRFGKGWPPEVDDSEIDRELHVLWLKNGDYEEEAPIAQRKASCLLWKKWLDDTKIWHG